MADISNASGEIGVVVTEVRTYSALNPSFLVLYFGAS